MIKTQKQVRVVDADALPLWEWQVGETKGCVVPIAPYIERKEWQDSVEGSEGHTTATP